MMLHSQKRVFACLMLSAVLLTVSCDGCNWGVGSIVVDGSGVKSVAASPEAQIHFFFDRTVSMQGFTAKGDSSEYVTALPALWAAADSTFPNMDAHFYEYGETFISEFKNPQWIKMNVVRSSFYGGSAVTDDGNRVKRADVEFIKDEKGTRIGLPFASVAAYTKTLNEQGRLFVIVTDLYEQNRDDPFSRFYRGAFAEGLSCAFFAVESSFSGEIYSISRVKTEEAKNVDNSKSTFFICIAGESGIVSSYCASLTKALVAQKILFDSAVFIVKPGEKFQLHHGEQVMAGSNRRFDLPENAYKMVNIRPQEINVLNQTSASRFESYQLLTGMGSRWSAGLPLHNINPQSFVYKPEFALSFSEGESGKRSEQKEATQFTGISGSNDIVLKIPPEAGADTDYPLYLVVETKNHGIKKGWYKIEYNIVPEAVPVPDWVSALNAHDISALEESAKGGGRVKTLQLAIVYQQIAEAYNGTKRSIYKDELYLVKK